MREVVSRGVDKFTEQGISNMVWALGKLGKAQHPVLDVLMREVKRRGHRQIQPSGNHPDGLGAGQAGFCRICCTALPGECTGQVGAAPARSERSIGLVGLMLRLRGHLRSWHDAKAVYKPEVTPAMTKGEDNLLCNSIHKQKANGVGCLWLRLEPTLPNT